jgi:hypothetical protein
MKLKLLILTGLCCGLSYGAVTFQGIVSNPTTDTGGALPAGTTAALVVDLDGSGVPASLNPFSVSVGGLLNGDLVAAITVSLSNFGISSISAQIPTT